MGNHTVEMVSYEATCVSKEAAKWIPNVCFTKTKLYKTVVIVCSTWYTRMTERLQPFFVGLCVVSKKKKKEE